MKKLITKILLLSTLLFGVISCNNNNNTAFDPFDLKNFVSIYESEYITAESTEEGIKIKITLKDGEDFNYEWSGIRETTTQLKYGFKEDMKQPDGSFEFYFPFVEKDTFYVFAFDGEVINGDASNYPNFIIKSVYDYIPLDVSVLEDFYENSTTECNIQEDDSGTLSYSLITTNTNSEELMTMFSRKIGEKGSWREQICGVWGNSSWSNTSWGWGSSVQDLTAALSNNSVARDTYQVSVNFAITVDGNTWNTNDKWSDLYEFDLWKGVIYENEEAMTPKTKWYNIYLFDDNDVYGLCEWWDNGYTNPYINDSEFGNYERNGNEITLYNPEILELITVFTIDGDVMTSEDLPGIEFNKL